MLEVKWKLGKSVLFILMSMILVGNLQAQSGSDGVLAGRLRVKFTESSLPVNGMEAGSGDWIMDYQGRKIRIYRMERVFPYDARTEARTRYAGLHLWYDLWYEELPATLKTFRTARILPEIQYTEPVCVSRPTGKQAAWNGVPLANLKPNDLYWVNLWNLNSERAGSNVTKFSDINVQEAWGVTTGRPEVIVAVMDSGIDYEHEDLAGNIWRNENEIPGNGVDDDNNGYIDDVYGVNFVGKKPTDTEAWYGPIVRGWHGTHVGGIIAARTNNTLGISGIAGGWGEQPGVKIMCCQILEEMPGSADSPAAFKYAADHGAVISNNSWELDGNPTSMSKVLQEGIDYFIKYAGTDPGDPTGNTQAPGAPMKGGIVFFGAGNSNKSTNCWPAMYEKVLAVSNLNQRLVKADNSNFGDWISFAAPGTDIRSTYYEAGGRRLYLPASGTSMSCPHIAGVAALVLSEFGGPGYTAQQLKEKLLAATHDIDDYNPNYRGQLGRFIDAGMALAVDQKKAPAQVTDLAVKEVTEKDITLTWRLTADEDDKYVESCRFYYSEEPLNASALEGVEYIAINTREKSVGETVTQTLKLRSGVSYYFGVVEYDRWGNASPMSNLVRGNLSLTNGFMAGQREVHLKWLGTSGVRAWTVRWKAKNDAAYKKVTVNTAAYNLTMLEPDTEYHLEVVDEDDFVVFQKTFRTEVLSEEFSSILLPVGGLIAGEAYWPVVRNIQITPKNIVWKVDGKEVDVSQDLTFEAGKHLLRAEVTTADGRTEILIREIEVLSR